MKTIIFLQNVETWVRNDDEKPCLSAYLALTCSVDMRQMTGEVGSYRYMAPELVRHEAYNAKADIYSWAILSWEVLAVTRPYSGITESSFIKVSRSPFGVLLKTRHNHLASSLLRQYISRVRILNGSGVAKLLYLSLIHI